MTTHSHARRATPANIVTLLLGLAAAGIVALSIHVVMLSLGVPFPSAAPPTWARWLNSASSAIATLYFLNLARPRIERWGFLPRLLITFVVLVTVRETFRSAIMAGVVTSAWTFSAISMLPVALAGLFILALLCTIAMSWARSSLIMGVVGLVVSGIYVFVQPLIGQAFAPVIESFAALSHDDLYTPPYPLVVMIPAYLTFAEAVLGATIIAALIWDQLPAGRWKRAMIVALLVSLVKGVIVATFLFSFFTDGSVARGVLSYSQFLFEFLALGLLTGLAWGKFRR